MFDLNVDSFPENEAETALDYRYSVSAEGSGASSSSVVNVDDAPGTADAVDGIEDDGDEVAEDLRRPDYVTWQLFPGKGEGCGSNQGFESEFRVGSSATEWLNLSISGSASCYGSSSLANTEQTPPEMRILQQQVIQKQQVRRSRRGPRSRSSQYRGVTFYRRTGRWESHIWDCGKQVYLGGFDTAHAAARAYDRAAIKFRGLDADINFILSDYEADMNQMKNLTKEEFVQVLRRQRTGVSWGSSRYKGLSSPNTGGWDANMAQYQHKAYDKAGTECTGIETVNSFGASNYEMKMPVEANNEGGDTEYFDVKVGLHQGSALSPFLFATVMDVLTRGIQGDIPWCMLFADDIVLVGDSRTEVNSRLDVWRQALESKGFKLSRTKTEYVEFNFGATGEAETEVSIGDHVVPRVESFRYLGSVMQSDGGLDADIQHRIQMGWLKWRSASGVLCDKKVPHKLKGKFYRTVVRPTLLYGAECWPLTKAQEQKLKVAEMRMLRWMCGHTLMDKIRNEVIRAKVGVASICDKLRETRLRWFGHVQRRSPDAPVRRGENLALPELVRGRGRPRKSWMETIRHDLAFMSLTEDLAQDRALWRERIRVLEG